MEELETDDLMDGEYLQVDSTGDQSLDGFDGSGLDDQQMDEVCNLETLQIDLFTNVSQIYGCLFPRDLATSHFINLYLTN